MRSASSGGTSRRTPAPASWSRTARAADGGVEVTITDTGSGMSPEVLSRAYEPFFTTRLGQGGSGLGLHICYNIVHTLLGGSIRVQSVMGEGMRFVIDVDGRAISVTPSIGVALFPDQVFVDVGASE